MQVLKIIIKVSFKIHTSHASQIKKHKKIKVTKTNSINSYNKPLLKINSPKPI